jgi:hypothetical protein
MEVIMKKVTLLSSLFFNAILMVLFLSIQKGFADSDIPAGNVSGIWTLDNSPYYINGEITIPNDSTLTIEPGAEVVFTGHYKFNVQGRLLAIGTVQDTITFTAQDTKTGWHGIRFMSTPQTNDTSKIIYCRLQYGKANTGNDYDISGGAIFVLNFSKLIISNCLLHHNSCGSSGQPGGGAICLWNSSSTICNNTLLNNNAPGSGVGGGIICWQNANASISNNLISNNTAGNGGAGIYIGGSNPIVINNIITNNRSYDEGGGIRCNYSSRPLIINNTIVNNQANSGGGIHCDGNSDPILINTILYGNTANAGNQVYLADSGSDPNFLYCDIEGGKDQFKGAGAGVNYSGVYKHNIDSDPLFMSAEAGDFHLSDSSHCIGGGNDSVQIGTKWYQTPPFDFDGNSRPNPKGSKPDIGAFENALSRLTTDVAGGDVSGTWTLANSPYHINGEIAITDSQTLIIEPGVEVVFTGHYKFNVQGRLLAIGTVQDTITFTAQDTKTGWHGIRFINTPETNDTSKIIYCRLQYGKANTGNGLDRSGGAILISRFDKVLVSNCLFDFNVNNGDLYSTGGAAIFIEYASPVITNSTFTNNVGITGVIGCLYDSQAIISNNVFTNNKCRWGGGVACGISFKNRPVISGNYILDNSAEDGGGVYLVWTTNALVINNVIIRNHATGEGGGINCEDSKIQLIANNTVAYNSAPYGGGIECDDDSDPILLNNIFYGNSANTGNQVIISMNSSDPSFLYCDIEGGRNQFKGAGAGDNYTGLYINNIDSDPMFADADNNNFHLMDSSSCISYGADSIEVSGKWYYAPYYDIEGNPRPNPPGTAPDIGACENHMGHKYEPLPTDIKGLIFSPTEFQLSENYPNPFNSGTTIQYKLKSISQVKLSVYDLLGNEVQILVNEQQSAGEYKVFFDAAKLADGIYFYIMQVQFENGYKHVEARKLALVR